MLERCNIDSDARDIGVSCRSYTTLQPLVSTSPCACQWYMPWMVWSANRGCVTAFGGRVPAAKRANCIAQEPQENWNQRGRHGHTHRLGGVYLVSL